MATAKVKLILSLFSIFLFAFSILLSYNLTIFFTDLSPHQKTTLNYLQDQKELNLNYTVLEFSHLDDVKKVMVWADYFFYLSGLVLGGIVLYFCKDRFKLKKLFLWGGIITTAVMGTILLFAIISFKSSFTVFHQIFFPQGNWQFPAGSLLIQTFPLEFFVKTSLLIFILTLLGGIVFILLGIYLKDGDAKRN